MSTIKKRKKQGKYDPYWISKLTGYFICFIIGAIVLLITWLFGVFD